MNKFEIGTRMVMKINIQQTMQTKFGSKQRPQESAWKCDLQILFLNTHCYEYFR